MGPRQGARISLILDDFMPMIFSIVMHFLELVLNIGFFIIELKLIS